MHLSINKWSWRAVWLVCVLIWLEGLPGQLSKIPANEAFLFYQNAKVLNGQDILSGIVNNPLEGHPPLYPYLVAWSLSIFGDSFSSARLIGIGAYFVSAFLVYFIATVISQGTERSGYAASSAVALYMASPLVIQGSLLLEIDNTILTPLIAAAVLMIVHPVWHTRRWYEPVLAIIIAILLWTKWTTPLVPMGCGIIYYGLRRDDRFWPFIRVCIIGVIFFFATWWLKNIIGGGYLPMENGIQYLLGSIYLHTNISGSETVIPTIVKRSARLVLWMSPFVIVTVGFIFVERIMQYSRRICDLTVLDFILLNIAVIFMGYLLIGGTAYGFPRYHIPMMPLVCAVIGYRVSPLLYDAFNSRYCWFSCAVFFGVLMMGAFIVPDPLYLANFVYKERLSLAPDDLTNIHLRLGIYLLLLTVMFCVPLFLYRRMLYPTSWTQAGLLSLCLCALGTMGGLDMLQARAPYRTAYEYGETGTQEVVSTLRNVLSENDRVFGPLDINFMLEKYDSPTLNMGSMQSRERMKEIISDPAISAVVYSPGTLTVDQYIRIIQSRTIQNALFDRFRRTKIGSYEVWLPDTSGPSR